MMAANPKLVSVELGANEVLEARYGIAIHGGNLASFDQWAADYDQVLDNVQKVSKMAVVVGLIDDLGHAAAFRTGDELWNDQGEFLQDLYVAIQPDCQNSPNLIFIPFAVPTAAAYGAAYYQAHLGPFPFSCAGQGPATPDFILTPSEQTTVNDLMHRMTAHIQSEATRRGFAYFALGSLYDRNDIKGPFSLGVVLGTAQPVRRLLLARRIAPERARSDDSCPRRRAGAERSVQPGNPAAVIAAATDAPAASVEGGRLGSESPPSRRGPNPRPIALRLRFHPSVAAVAKPLHGRDGALGRTAHGPSRSGRGTRDVGDSASSRSGAMR